MPVITIVMSFDPDGWDGPVSLCEMMPDIDPRAEKFVQDYRINVIDPKELADEEIDLFTTEMREVVRAVNCSNDKERYRKAVVEDARFKRIHRDTAQLINTVTNLKLEIENEKEEVNMCKAMEELMEDSRAEGRKEGRSTDVRNLLEHFSAEQVATFLKMPLGEVQKIASNTNAASI